MKIKGEKIEKCNVETIVIPRGDGEPIVFLAQAVLDFDPFLKQCPEPQPPVKILKGGVREYNVEAPAYKEAKKVHTEKQIAWMILKSLEATPDLEWETVKLEEHRTWLNFQKELQDAGFSHFEVQRIIDGVMAANCLSERRIQEARDAFQHGCQVVEEDALTSGQSTEPAST